MTSISNPSFESTGIWGGGWDGNGSFAEQNGDWATDGSYCVKKIIGTTGTIVQINQLVNINSNFDLVYDIKFIETNADFILYLFIDDDTVHLNEISADNAVHTNQTYTISGLSGNHYIGFQIYHPNDGNPHTAYIDNLRIQNEAFHDIYVDLNRADDTGNGFSWATAKKNMNAGYALLPTSLKGTLHVASGNYSGQTGITYNKSWFLSPEDPNSTGAKNVKIPPSV